MASLSAYPKEYKGPRPIEDQISRIASILELNPIHALDYAKHLPDIASFVPENVRPHVNWFAIPTDRVLGTRLFSAAPYPYESYAFAVGHIQKMLANSRKFYNRNARKIDGSHLRVRPIVAGAMHRIEHVQREILLIAAQLGICRVGDVNTAQLRYAKNEFGLTSLAGLAIALTHPERFVRFDELDMDLPGDQYLSQAETEPDHAPYIGFCGQAVEFGVHEHTEVNEGYGSATFFVPQ